MTLATIIDPGYKIALFLHILAVVLAFGPTFGYGFFFSVAPPWTFALWLSALAMMLAGGYQLVQTLRPMF